MPILPWGAPPASGGGGSTSPYTMPLLIRNLVTAATDFSQNSTGSASYANDSRRLLTSTGGTASSFNSLYWDWTSSNDTDVYHGTVTMACNGYSSVDGTDFDIFIGVGDVGPSGSGLGALTNRHFGFRRTRVASGAITLVATQADGTTEAHASLTDTGTNQNYFFSAIKTSTSIQYYVNGVLGATITTNIPSGATGNTYPMEIAVTNSGVATNTQILVREFTYTQQY